jgi:hypothetical protein
MLDERSSPGSKPDRLSVEQRMHKAALLLFCEAVPPSCAEELEALTLGEWKRLLRWLHLSGLALRFFHRMQEQQWSVLLPHWALEQLQQDLTDNRERTQGMLAESIAIQHEFLRSGLRYATHKGVSLWPCSIRMPELRLQFDLDFLLAAADIPQARQILEARGYRFYAANGGSGEFQFKRNEKPGLTLKHVYRNTGSWAVELHAESASMSRQSRLNRLQWRDIEGFSMPVLSPVDLLLAQGMHAYKDVCGPFSRASLLVEFRSHVLFRRDDLDFWSELSAQMEEDPQAHIGLGIVTLLITGILGEFAPAEMTRWTVNRVPQLAQLWCQRYGARIVLGNYPGSKLFLLLRHALGESPDATGAGRSMRQMLAPFRMPSFPIRAFPYETIAVRLGRYRMQLALLLERLRFHIVEGLRFWWEWRLWRQVIRSLE